MIVYKLGNIFDSQCQTLVNPVNCVGVMGKGLALQFKQRFPEMFKDYKFWCTKGWMRLGQPLIWQPPWVPPEHYVFRQSIVLFPTKDHWRDLSQLDDIDRGLYALKSYLGLWNIRSLAIPPLGCGLGGLKWIDVKHLIENYLSNLDIPVEVYEPTNSRKE